MVVKTEETKETRSGYFFLESHDFKSLTYQVNQSKTRGPRVSEDSELKRTTEGTNFARKWSSHIAQMSNVLKDVLRTSFNVLKTSQHPENVCRKISRIKCAVWVFNIRSTNVFYSLKESRINYYENKRNDKKIKYYHFININGIIIGK